MDGLQKVSPPVYRLYLAAISTRAATSGLGAIIFPSLLCGMRLRRLGSRIGGMSASTAALSAAAARRLDF